jgi:hypothetical protein
MPRGGKVTHGRRWEPEYYSWYSMKTRCGNPNHNDYPNWGGRGITYDPRWEDFNKFFADMGPSPGKGYCLERKDNEGDYCKDNCVWGLKSHQPRNQRTTKLSMEKAISIRIKYASGGYTYKELAQIYGVGESMIWSIVKNHSWKES